MSLFLFCFKQKTAYEMRISDWSSDVCSSDLQVVEQAIGHRGQAAHGTRHDHHADGIEPAAGERRADVAKTVYAIGQRMHIAAVDAKQIGRASCRERVCQYV